MGILKLWTFISFSKQACLECTKEMSYNLQKYISNGVFHTPIKAHLTPSLKGFMVKSQIPSLTHDLSFDHNLCILGVNEQCGGTLSIYTWRIFQWYLGGPIWCLFAFSTNVQNIWDSRTSATPKVGVHLGVIGLHILHSPPFVRVCFTPKHTFLTSWTLALCT